MLKFHSCRVNYTTHKLHTHTHTHTHTLMHACTHTKKKTLINLNPLLIMKRMKHDFFCYLLFFFSSKQQLQQKLTLQFEGQGVHHGVHSFASVLLKVIQGRVKGLLLRPGQLSLQLHLLSILPPEQLPLCSRLLRLEKIGQNGYQP